MSLTTVKLVALYGPAIGPMTSAPPVTGVPVTALEIVAVVELVGLPWIVVLAGMFVPQTALLASGFWKFAVADVIFLPS
ncbi:hypothetical protein [Cryptosporangium aurantiacum]|uniref:hypothetical protein n=1 Tax=Cryptosporangium aurantiacum TaxID=134849 RepID=UPI0015BD7EEA|nr:hypothetical protein [Cryptosporangium aurantiacum]